MARRKVDLRKDALIRVRVTRFQRTQMTRAARQTGQSLSSWLRAVALVAARRQS